MSKYSEYVAEMLAEGLEPAPFPIWVDIEATMDEEARR